MAPAGLEPARPRVRIGSSARLSYGADVDVAGRSRTCAPRVSDGRSTPLSYGHVSGRGWSRTSDLLCVKQVLGRSELLAREAPGQGVEPRSPRSDRGVLPVRRSRNESRFVHRPHEAIDAARTSMTRRPRPNAVFHATRLLFDPGSTAGGRVAERSPSCVEELWSPSLARLT
jgi:hypothetical protein